MPRARGRAVLPLCFLASLSISLRAPAFDEASAQTLPHEALIQDVRELSELLEDAHPDPYSGGGGKIAYHRRLQELLRALPQAGLSRQGFLAVLEPFLADLRDGHTSLSPLEPATAEAHPGGVPFFLEVVEGRLYVDAVVRGEDRPWIGAILESVEGVPVGELLERETRRQGHDNVHHALSALARDGALSDAGSLRRLVPEWRDPAAIRMALRTPSGERREIAVAPSSDDDRALLRPDSRIELSDEPRWLGYRFLDPDRRIAFLWIHNMTTYREMFELSRAAGDHGWDGWASRVHELVQGRPAPGDPDELIAGIPSATETFRSLFREMKSAGSRALVLDLRRNFGGNDLMVPILLHFLVGLDETVSVLGETAAIQKLSPFFGESRATGIDLATIAYASRFPLTVDDYDFSLDPGFMAGPELDAAVRAELERLFGASPTFTSERESRGDGRAYRPPRIVALGGNRTQSSGFDLLTHLHRLGAEVVGVTPSQAGNSFGNIRPFTLTRSGLQGYVSTKAFVRFPGEAPTGFALEPDHPLTYGKLAELGFDPNASLLLALEILGRDSLGEEGGR